MPRITQETIKATQILLEKTKVFTINELASFLSCSIPTARLKLKLWQSYTSYNQNGRYYALYNVPKFDKNDIWCLNKICFSKHGNLKKTIIYLVNNSIEGLSGKQLGSILKLEPQSFLHHFKSIPGIQREKHEGIYIYFSDKPKIYKLQRENRYKNKISYAQHKLSNHDAIIILTSIIRHNGIEVNKIMELPEVRKSNISRYAIENFLEAHNILKKTSD